MFEYLGLLALVGVDLVAEEINRQNRSRQEVMYNAVNTFDAQLRDIRYDEVARILNMQDELAYQSGLIALEKVQQQVEQEEQWEQTAGQALHTIHGGL